MPKYQVQYTTPNGHTDKLPKLYDKREDAQQLARQLNNIKAVYEYGEYVFCEGINDVVHTVVEVIDVSRSELNV